MNILFVDDELETLDGIINNIDFKKIGIHNVYIETNPIHAKELLKTTAIDILVVDIEMPDISGIELLHWVIEEKLQLITIFCTAYADFNYARKAIELHAFDYYLKPIFYQELEEKLAGAVNEVNHMKQKINYEKYGKEIAAFHQELKNNFWKDMLENITLSRNSLIYKLGQQYGIFYQEEDSFLFLNIDLSVENEQDESENIWTLSDLGYYTKDKLLKSFSLNTEAFFSVKKNVIFFVFLIKEQPYTTNNTILLCDQLKQSYNQKFGISCNIYFMENISYPSVLTAYQKMEAVFRHNIVAKNQIYNVQKVQEQEREYFNPDIEAWETLLSDSQTQQLKEQLQSYYNRMKISGIFTKKEARAFCTDIMQLVYNVLQKKQLLAHEIFGNEIFAQYFGHASESVKSMQDFVEYVFDVTKEAIERTENSDSIIETIKQHITQNLDADITRENLANIVYLNPDYLARIFKADVGKTLGAYIRDMRMEKAKYLLKNSGKTIGAIAFEVGYDNFSYFSQLFRKHTGVSPQEFRRKN